MSKLYFVPLIFFNYLLIAQDDLDSILLDNSIHSNLTHFEAELLNSLLENSRKNFDFHEKKILFVTGSSGNRIISKDEWINYCIKPWIDNGIYPNISLIKLSEFEKHLSGGYDAIVLSFVKHFSKKRKDLILNKVNKNIKMLD